MKYCNNTRPICDATHVVYTHTQRNTSRDLAPHRHRLCGSQPLHTRRSPHPQRASRMCTCVQNCVGARAPRKCECCCCAVPAGVRSSWYAADTSRLWPRSFELLLNCRDVLFHAFLPGHQRLEHLLDLPERLCRLTGRVRVLRIRLILHHIRDLAFLVDLASVHPRDAVQDPDGVLRLESLIPAPRGSKVGLSSRTHRWERLPQCKAACLGSI